MPLALVQRRAGIVSTASATTFTGTFASTPTPGNLLICCAISDITMTMTSAGWTLAVSAVNNCAVYQWEKIAGASEPTSVQLTLGISDSCSMMLEEWSGNTSSPLDRVAAQAVQASTANPITGTTTATAQADEQAIACIGNNPTTGTNISYSAWTNAFTEVNDAQSTGSGNNSSLGVAEKALSATGAQSTSPTGSSAQSNYSGLIATYMAALPPALPVQSNLSATMKARR